MSASPISSSNYQGGAISGSIDLTNAQAGIHPTRELSFSATAGYSDNLSGQLIQSIVSAGGAVAGLNSNGSSNSLDLEGVAAYQPRQNVEATAYVEYRTQLFSGLRTRGDFLWRNRFTIRTSCWMASSMVRSTWPRTPQTKRARIR